MRASLSCGVCILLLCPVKKIPLKLDNQPVVCFLRSEEATTLAACMLRGEVKTMRQPVPRVTAKTDTTMIVSFIDQESLGLCPPLGAARWRMKREE